MTRTRQTPKARKRAILAAALDVAQREGLACVRRDRVADAAGCSASLVSTYYGTMTQLRRAVMREAIRTECVPVVAQGLALGDTAARKAPAELRTRAAVWCANG